MSTPVEGLHRSQHLDHQHLSPSQFFLELLPRPFYEVA